MNEAFTQKLPGEAVAPTVSFNTLQTTSRPFGDQIMERLVVGDLSGTGSTAEADIQKWSSLTRPNAEEVKLMGDPRTIGKIHGETAQMIARHGGLHLDRTKISQPEAEFIRGVRQSQKVRLDADGGQALATSINLWRQGRGTGAKLRVNAGYAACVLDTTKGKVNLADRFGSKVDGIRPRIAFQEGIRDSYIHWATKGVTGHQLATGKSPDFSYRVYLNPAMVMQVGIFSELMQRLDAENLTVAGKMIDRALELALASATNPTPGAEPDVRADAIVLGVLPTEADKVLAITEEIYKLHYPSFQGRPVPKIPQKVADGVAVAAESPQSGESLTTHRGAVLAAAAAEVRSRFGLKPGDPMRADRGRLRTIFESIWHRHATQAGINPRNFAWNL